MVRTGLTKKTSDQLRCAALLVIAALGGTGCVYDFSMEDHPAGSGPPLQPSTSPESEPASAPLPMGTAMAGAPPFLEGNPDPTDPDFEPTPSPSPVTEVTVAFQEGVSPTVAYAGTRDTYILARAPAENRGESERLEADGSQPQGSGLDVHALLSFDVSVIPAGSIVTNVQLRLHVLAASPHAYDMFALTTPWVEGEATWASPRLGQAWTGGVFGVSDHAPELLSRANRVLLGSMLWSMSSNGVAAVQRWVDDPTLNFGLVVRGSMSEGGVAFVSSEGIITSQRPELIVVYRVP